MNKNDLAKKLAKRAGLSHAKAAEVVDALFDSRPGKGIIATELDADRKVSITGFGTFETRRRGARQGRNPATGEAIQIAAKKYPAFKAAKGLKDRVADVSAREFAPFPKRQCPVCYGTGGEHERGCPRA